MASTTQLLEVLDIAERYMNSRHGVDKAANEEAAKIDSAIGKSFRLVSGERRYFKTGKDHRLMSGEPGLLMQGLG